MDDVIKEKIANQASELLSYVQQGADFVVEQAPLLVQEVLQWGFWSNVVEIFQCLFGLALAWIFFRWARRKLAEVKGDFIDMDEAVGIPMLIGAICSGVLTVISVCALFESVKVIVLISVAPRLYLLQQLREIIG